MPNYYAHLEFGRRVLESLPPTLRRALEREKDAFALGLYGPDPLFFYNPISQNRVRRAGLGMHKRTARAPMERLRRAISERRPMALGYAAGFLCHYALDSACHGYIKARASEGDITHAAIEAELDRHIMERNLLDPLHDTPMPEPELPRALFETAAAIYPGVRPRQYQTALTLFRKSSRLLTLISGTPLLRLADWVTATFPYCAPMRGAVLDREHNPACEVSSEYLWELLLEQVTPTAAELAQYLQAVERDESLSEWFDRSFSGTQPEPEEDAGEELGKAARAVI